MVDAVKLTDTDYQKVVQSIEDAFTLPETATTSSFFGGLGESFKRLFNPKIKYFNKSGPQKIVEFLLLANRAHVVDLIKKDYDNDSPRLYNAKARVKCFAKLLEKHAPEVFKIDVEQYQKDKESFVVDLQRMNDYKKLVSQFENSIGLNSIIVKRLGEIGKFKKDSKVKHFDFNDSASLAKALDAFMQPRIIKYLENQKNQNNENRFIQVFEFTENRLDNDRQEVKKINRSRKNKLFNGLVFVCFLLAIGEGFQPANFYLMNLMGASISGVVLPTALVVGISALVFYAAFKANFLQFLPDSFNTYKNLLLKGRLHKDALGNELSFSQKLKNYSIVLLAACSGLTLAVLSYRFTLFSKIAVALGFSASIGLNEAFIISIATLICFTGRLAFAVMGLAKKESLFGILDFVKKLTVSPAQDIIATLKNKKLTRLQKLQSVISNGLLLTFNIAALTVMATLSVSVVAGTSGLFYSSLLQVSFIAKYGSTAAAVITGLAEISLGTFFVKSVCELVNALRSMAVTGFSMLFSSGKTLQPSAVNSASNLGPKPNHYRDQVVMVSMGFFTGLIACGSLNTSGFYLNYFNSDIASQFITNTFGFMFAVASPFLVALARSASHILSASSYAASSIWGALSGSREVIDTIEPMHPVAAQPVAGPAGSDAGAIAAASSSSLDDERATLPSPTGSVLTSIWERATTTTPVDGSSQGQGAGPAGDGQSMFEKQHSVGAAL